MPAAPARLFRRLRRATAFGWVLATSAVALGLAARHRSDPASRARWLQGVCRRSLRALDVRVTATGVPAEGVCLAANHISYLDILVLGAQAPLIFVAKREVGAWPVWGWFARAGGTCFVDRTRSTDVGRVADEMTRLLQTGHTVVLFAEGTSSDGAGVLPFKSSLLEPATRPGRPVAAVALHYGVAAGHSAGREVGYWGDMTLMPHLWNLLALPWIEARVGWGAAQPAGTDRKELARQLHAEVVRLKAPLAAG